MFGGERSSDACVSEFYLIVVHQHTHPHAAETVPHALLIEILHQLELLLKGNTGIVPDVQQSLLVLLVLFLLLVLLLDHFADISRPDHSHTHISGSQSSHIVGSVSCVENASVWHFLEELDYHFLVVWACPCEDVDVLVVIMRQVFGC